MIRFIHQLLVLVFVCLATVLLLKPNTGVAQEAETDPSLPIEQMKKDPFVKRVAKYIFTFPEDKRFKIYPIPTVSYSTENSLSMTLNNYMMMRLGKDGNPMISDANIYLKYNLMGRFTAAASWKLYLNKDNRLNGRIKYNSSPQSFYGIGNETAKDDKEQYKIKYLGLSLNYKRKVMKDFYVGFSYDFENTLNLDHEADGKLAEGDIEGADGYLISGTGLSLQYDNTNSSVFPTEGRNFSGDMVFYHPMMGSYRSVGRFEFGMNSYHKLDRGKKDHIIAYQLKIGLHASSPPFTQLFTVGGSSLRGYNSGRFVDRHVVTTQLEYRFPIVWRFRGAAFAGIGDVTDELGRLSIADLKWSVGGGLRIVLDQKEKISLRLDYAVGREGNSGFYISLNEAF